MHLRVISLGKTDQGFVQEGLEVYLNRLKHYCKLEWIELDNRKILKQGDKELVKQDEWKLLEKYIGEPGWRLWLCDESGKEYTSISFAKKLDHTLSHCVKGLVICIGGPFGFPDAAKAKADLLLSLSQMTMTHQMVRVFLTEQLYRSFTIINGTKYHNA